MNDKRTWRERREALDNDHAFGAYYEEKYHHVQRWLNHLVEQEAEIDRLQAIVDRLPKTADGVPLVHGDTVWIWVEHDDPNGMYLAEDRFLHLQFHDAAVLDECDEARLDQCYSTREAAEQAAGEVQSGG